MSCDSLPNQVFAAQSEAIRRILEADNFVHTVEHTISVNLCAHELNSREGGFQDPSMLAALSIAAYWHDVARYDRMPESAEEHEMNAIHSLRTFAGSCFLSPEVVELACDAIASHRNRGQKTCHRGSILASLLWDADKLDNFRSERVLQLLNWYSYNTGSGEFTREGSLHYWRSFDSSFANRLSFAASRAIFQQRFPAFRRVVENASALHEPSKVSAE